MSDNAAVPQIHSDVPFLTSTCIWCLSPACSIDVEHIIPESMGGPWVLPGNVVCKMCNQQLSHLDRAVSDPFDFITFVRGVQGKKGRKKKVRSRGNLLAEHQASGPVIRINSSTGAIELPDGMVLSARGKSARNVSSTVHHLAGDTVAIDLQVPLAFDRAATRGVVKIGFEALVWYLGAEAVLGPEYGAVRDYVLADKGQRRVIMLQPEDLEYRHELNPPLFGPGLGPVIRFRLAIVEFLVDLTPDCRCVSDLEGEVRRMHGEQGWHVIPDHL